MPLNTLPTSAFKNPAIANWYLEAQQAKTLGLIEAVL
jgi:hypothetical protein